MPTSTIAVGGRSVKRGETTPERLFPWQNILVGIAALALFGLGIWMRLRDLGLPFDRDSYDEGVYWQSLRAMSGGYHLYQQIFYSQPPFFLVSVFPTYMLFGQTIWAARLGVALISLLGLLGAFLLGKAVSGRLGALAALLLLIVDPLYLMQSQTLQAEAPYVAFSFLSVGLAYLWWKRPDGIPGLCYATLSGATLSLSILCKLLGVAALVPVGLLLLAHIWRIFQQEQDTKKRLVAVRAPLIGILAFLVVAAAILLPFVGSLHQMIQGVVTFHTEAGRVFGNTRRDNLSQIQNELTTLLALAAFYGTLVALLRRNWLVLPLIAWFLTTIVLLWQQVPLFHHHFVALTPPLISLAVMGIGPVQPLKRLVPSLYTITTVVAVLVILLVMVADGVKAQQYYRGELAKSTDISVVKWDVNVERDLQSVTQPDQLVVTDAQFLSALAKRSTPPQLVDTSGVRADTGYLTVQQLIAEASQPQVHAVLFSTGRLLRIKNIDIFYAWLTKHFRRMYNYYSGKELWVRVS